MTEPRTDDLDAAWAALEAVRPEDYYRTGIELDFWQEQETGKREWFAWVGCDGRTEHNIEGPLAASPVEALRALVEQLTIP